MSEDSTNSKTIGKMLADDEYESLCEAVERLNSTELLFTPEWHDLPENRQKGVLHYNLSGDVRLGEKSLSTGGNYIAQFEENDSIESVADQVVKQCREDQEQALYTMRDGREMRDTELSLDWLYNHSR